MLLRFLARATPAPLTAPGGPPMSGLFATDTESNVPVYLAERAAGGPEPTAMDCFVGKTIPSRNDVNGALQNQAQDANGIDPGRLWGCTDPFHAPAPGTILPVGALVFNGALNCRTRLAATLTIPAVNGTATITVADTSLSVTKAIRTYDGEGAAIDTPTAFPLLVVDDEIPIDDGMYRVISIDDATTATVRYLGEPCAFLTPLG